MMQLKFMFCLFVVEAMAIVPVAVVVSTFASPHIMCTVCVIMKNELPCYIYSNDNDDYNGVDERWVYVEVAAWIDVSNKWTTS